MHFTFPRIFKICLFDFWVQALAQPAPCRITDRYVSLAHHNELDLVVGLVSGRRTCRGLWFAHLIGAALVEVHEPADGDFVVFCLPPLVERIGELK